MERLTAKDCGAVYVGKLFSTQQVDPECSLYQLHTPAEQPWVEQDRQSSGETSAYSLAEGTLIFAHGPFSLEAKAHGSKSQDHHTAK